MQLENTALLTDANVDNNLEFIAEQTTEKKISVLGHVFKSIFVEIPKDFVFSIWNFFARYVRHYKESFKFFNRPSLKVPPFDKKDFKENTQHSFEIALIFTGILIFLIKQDVIPVNKDLQEKYGNDIIQMFFELVIFLIFAVAYTVLILLTVLSGRVFRLLFRIPVTRGESDILFAYLNNSFFSISALMAFAFRCSMQYEQIEGTDTVSGIIVLCLLLSLVLVGWWSVKFASLNKLSIMKRVLFYIFSITWFTILFGLSMSYISFFIIGA